MRKWTVRILAVLVLLLAAGGAAVWQGWLAVPWLPGQTTASRAAQRRANVEQTLPTVPVQRADTVIEDLQLTGKLTLRTVREVTTPVGEAVATVDAQVGDLVAAGDVLATLDRDQLTTDLDSAWLTLSDARQTLADLMAPATDLAHMAADAELLAAQEGLADLKEGPSAADVNAAAVAIEQAQVALEELQKRNDPNSNEVRQARYNLQQAQNAVQDAQTAYDAIAWKGGEDAASRASTLQNATISLESSRLNYEEATAPPDDLELRQAQLAVTQAQNNYNQLFDEATPSQIAQARVREAEAEDAIQQLDEGPTDQQVEEAEAAVVSALTNFEQLRSDLLTGSALMAPIAGLVTQMNVVEGQVVERGDTVAVVAELDAFKINLLVSEEYILLVKEQMPVAITVDVAPDVAITGTVTYVARVHTDSFTQDESTSFTTSSSTAPGNYPVVVEVADAPALASLRAGMNVQVTFVGSNQLPSNSWLVPASSIRRRNEQGDTGTIQLVRNGSPEALEVTVTEITQGEWQVVVSPDIQQGDRVVGAVTTFLNQSGTGGNSGGNFGGGNFGGGNFGGGNFSRRP